MQLKNEILSQLDSLLDDARRLDESFTMSDRGTTESAIGEHEHRAFATAARAAIRRLSGLDSEYYKSLPDIDQTRISVAGYGGNNISIIRGTLQSLRKAVEDGLLVSIEQKLRANFHDDFLEQAKSLVDAGYHVAAMVLIGGVLEDHMRKLCTNRSLTWNGNGSLSKYNDALRKADLYGQPTWRRIQAIADVRNEAAHGNGSSVSFDDVTDAMAYTHRLLADNPQ